MTDHIPHILFVDDERELLEGLQRSFHKMQGKWHMTFLDSAPAVIDYCARTAVDLVVTDLRMPEMDGTALVKKLNQVHPEIGCIMLSGTADLQDAAELINSTTISGFFSKPCEPEKLRDGICQALQKQARSVADIPGIDDLHQRYGLTPAEARLTHSLLAGAHLEQAAGLNGLTIASARTYLKRIFAKTGTNKQVDLIRKLITENK